MTESQIGQSRFTDLYSAVYALIDHAKSERDILRLDKGSHGSTNPFPLVRQVGAWFFRQRRGLTAFLAHLVANDERPMVDDLATVDEIFRPRVSVQEAFRLFHAASARRDESAQHFLTRVVDRTHALGRYRGGSSGYDDESRAFVAAYFRQAGIVASPREIRVFCGGAKGAFLSLLGAVLCDHHGTRLHRRNGRLLAPAGYYQSLRALPPVVGGEIDVVNELTASAVTDWIREHPDIPLLLYVPVVNNFNGRVLTEDRAREVAAVVLEHNRNHARRPVYVLGDDVYHGSVLNAGLRARPIGSITGNELDDPSLGDMRAWTVSVVSPSKTTALPTSRVAFAHTSNPHLGEALTHYRTMFSYGRVPQGDELTAAAAICLTPADWITAWNRTYADRVDWLKHKLAWINDDLGMDAFRMTPPDGGWYTALRINPRLVGASRVRSSVDALALCMYYASDRASGIGLLPGELAGYRFGDTTHDFVMRASMAVEQHDLFRFSQRLSDLGNALCGSDAPQIIDQALRRVRTVIPDLDEIVTNG